MTTEEPEPPPIPPGREIARLVLAMAIAPLTVPVLSLLLGLVTGTVPTGQNIYKWTFFIVAIPYTYAAGAIVGLPVHLVFRYLRWRAWWHYALAGLIGGFGFAEYAGRPGWDSLATLGFYGLATAGTGWAIAVRRWKRDRVESTGH